MADTLREEYETEEQTISEGDVATSVSFGKFESDLLCWDRWSSFSQNKYMEEIEKCSTPGSVARKKAFFEAHYKKIAEQKAELLLEQEQQREVDSLASDCPSNENQRWIRTIEFKELDGVDLGNTTNIDRTNGNGLNDDEQGLQTPGIKEVKAVISVIEENSLIGSQAKSKELPILIIDENQLAESQTRAEELPILVREENILKQTLSEGHSILVEEGNHSSGLQVQLEEASDFVNDNNSAKLKTALKRHPNTSTAKVNKVGDSKLELQKEPQKRTLASKDKNVARTKTKQLTATPKLAHSSVSRASKPLLASPAISSSKNSVKKESTPSILRKGNLSTTQRRTTNPTSLHMSHDLAPTKSGSASFTTTRRSLILENMGDKEIVKRAFKAFQKTGPLEACTRPISSPIRQVSKNVKKQNISSTSPKTPRKDTERLVKRAGASKTRPEAAPLSVGLKNEERAEKQTEFVKKLESKSKANKVEKARLQPKPKVVKEVETEKQHQSLNSKATTGELYHGQRIPSSYVNKDIANI